jgi:hypothetical protein
MAEINIADKTTQDAISASVGMSTDQASDSGTSLWGRLKAFIATWTTAKAAFLDAAVSSRASSADMASVKTAVSTNLDAAISSRASGAYWTSAKAAYLDAYISSCASAASLSVIKSLVGDANPGVADMTTVMNALKKISDAQSIGASPIRSVQRGTATAAGTTAINAVNTAKTVVISNSKGSAGSVAVSGSFRYLSSSNSFVPNSGSGGSLWSMINSTTDLTVKVYSAVLTNATTLTCDGPVEWQVVEYN